MDVLDEQCGTDDKGKSSNRGTPMLAKTSSTREANNTDATQQTDLPEHGIDPTVP